MKRCEVTLSWDGRILKGPPDWQDAQELLITFVPQLASAMDAPTPCEEKAFLPNAVHWRLLETTPLAGGKLLARYQRGN